VANDNSNITACSIFYKNYTVRSNNHKKYVTWQIQTENKIRKLERHTLVSPIIVKPPFFRGWFTKVYEPPFFHMVVQRLPDIYIYIIYIIYVYAIYLLVWRQVGHPHHHLFLNKFNLEDPVTLIELSLKFWYFSSGWLGLWQWWNRPGKVKNLTTLYETRGFQWYPCFNLMLKKALRPIYIF